MSSLSIEDLIVAKALLGPPIKRKQLVRTNQGFYEIDFGVGPWGTFTGHMAAPLNSIGILDLGDPVEVHRARVRLSKLKSKKRRGRRNGAAVRLLKNVPPTIRELERAMEARNRERPTNKA